MAKLDDIFKDNLSDHPIEKLDLDMSWNDFSVKRKNPKDTKLRILLGISIMLLLSLIAYIFLCKKNSNVEFQSKGVLHPFQNKEENDSIKSNKESTIQEVSPVITEKTRVIKKESTNKTHKPLKIEVQESPYLKKELQDSTKHRDIQIIKETIAKVDSANTALVAKKPVVIVKTKTVAIQKTDTILNLEEKKKRRNFP